MSDTRVALLFPGQGKLDGGGFAHCSPIRPYVRETFEIIDSVCGRRLGVQISDLLVDEGLAPRHDYSLVSHETLQLALFGASVAVYRFMTDRGVEPATLIGHSFGQIAALVCAGALSTSLGAVIVCERALALRHAPPELGSMAALRADSVTARVILAETKCGAVSVAVENSPEETLISGSSLGIGKVAVVARRRSIAFRRLLTQQPLHCPLLMDRVAADFLARIRDLEMRPLQAQVFSPHLGRYFRDTDKLPAYLARDIDTPLPFADAIRRLHIEGIRTFVECGVLGGFGRHVAACAADAVTLHAGLTSTSLTRLLDQGIVPAARGMARERRYPLRPRALSLVPATPGCVEGVTCWRSGD